MRVVIKVGTSTLAYENTGLLHIRRMKQLCEVLSDIKNAGHEVILVSSGAIDIVVVDSVAALVPRAEIDGEVLLLQGAVDIVSTDAGMLLLQELINGNTWLGDFNGVLLEDFYGVH